MHRKTASLAALALTATLAGCAPRTAPAAPGPSWTAVPRVDMVPADGTAAPDRCGGRSRRDGTPPPGCRASRRP